MPMVRVDGALLHVRDVGGERAPGAAPVVVLHGGWGYEFYPFDDAIAGIPRRFVIPDRTGYGRSPAREELPPGFHAAYAAETLAVLDAMGIERCVAWGHSDGAVIAALLAIRAPARCAGVILEAVHLDRAKPRSRGFFTAMAEEPDRLGRKVGARLEADHGPAWRKVIRAGGRAWLQIAATPDEDLYGGRLHELAVPALVLHGADDPRTEPGELDRLRREVPHAQVELIAGGQHSPHSERATAAECTRLARAFVERVSPWASASPSASSASSSP
ncbi:MAG TPA: alpha/beta hydrolase [Kofleriaceae bacterium]|nr:alpha/beta hydrolase [Kofleriaceae bacterium]